MIIKIDKLGRIVIPKGVRELLNINANDKLILSVNNNEMVIEKTKK